MAPPGLAAALRAADRRAGELVSQRRLAEAVTLNERMLAVAPDQLSLLVQKGRVLLLGDDADRALAHFESLTQRFPRVEAAWQGLGKAYYAQQLSADAVAAFSRAAQLSGAPALALYHRGMAHLLAGNFHDGWRDYEQRFAVPALQPRNFDRPRWDGAPLGGHRLLAAQPQLVTPVLQVVHRVITRHLLGQAGHKAEEADSRAVTLIQRFGSVANLNIHLHCLVLNGVYRRGAKGMPEFVEAPAPSDEALQVVLHRIITRLTQAAHPSGGAGRRRGRFDIYGRQRRRFGRGPHAQAAAGGGVYLPHRLRPARRPEGADGAGRHAQADGVQADAVRGHQWVQSASASMACWPPTPSCARWWCRRSPRRPPNLWRLPSARRTARTTERCG